MDTTGAGAGHPGPAVHPAVAPLSYLLGTWRGQGQGFYPTISSFSYAEELNFSHPNPLKPVIAYTQKTWRSPAGPVPQPMHAESGFWRLKPDGSVEFVIAQSTGLVEVQKGTHDAEERVIKLQSELVGNASKVKEITREFKLVNGELSYVVQMATTLTGLQPHLQAVLKKYGRAVPRNGKQQGSGFRGNSTTNHSAVVGLEYKKSTRKL